MKPQLFIVLTTAALVACDSPSPGGGDDDDDDTADLSVLPLPFEATFEEVDCDVWDGFGYISENNGAPYDLCSGWALAAGVSYFQYSDADPFEGTQSAVTADVEGVYYLWGGYKYNGGQIHTEVPFDFSDQANPTLTFMNKRSIGNLDPDADDPGDADCRVMAKAADGDWSELVVYGSDQGSWAEENVDLSDFGGDDEVYLKFEAGLDYFSTSGPTQWAIDEVSVTGD